MTERFQFRLFVAGDSPNSARAREAFARWCEEHLPRRYAIEIVDVLREPSRALEDSVFLTPTLIRLRPGVPRSVVGNLSDPSILRAAFLLD